MYLVGRYSKNVTPLGWRLIYDDVIFWIVLRRRSVSSFEFGIFNALQLEMFSENISILIHNANRESGI